MDLLRLCRFNYLLSDSASVQGRVEAGDPVLIKEKVREQPKSREKEQKKSEIDRESTE